MTSLTHNKNKLAKSRARIALIDADSVLYAAALGAEGILKGEGPNGEDEYVALKELPEVYNEVVKNIEGLIQDVGAEDAIVCLTATHSCFRYVLLPEYKANRATLRRPSILKKLQYAIMSRKPFGTLAVRGLEADDICGISQTSLQKAGLREPIIVSIDKDMKQIPGLLYSWIAKDKATGELKGIQETSGVEASRMHLYQTLVGDPVDNYTGCPGMGPVKANKLLDQCEGSSMWAQWEYVLGAFKKKGFTEDYALTQARVARILRDTDWNSKTHEVTLWTPIKDVDDMTVTPTETEMAGVSMDHTPKLMDVTTKLNLKTILQEREKATLQ